MAKRLTNAALDKRLRALSDFESELIHLSRRDVKLHFSNSNQGGQWRINYEKLMLKDEEIAVHKHDRFIDFEKHSHDYLELMFVYSGSITHVFEKETITLNKGELLLMDMNVTHGIKAASEEDIAINIMMKREFFDTFFLRQIGYQDTLANFVIDAIYNNGEDARYLYFRSGDNALIWQHMNQLLIEYYSRQNGVDIAVRAYMLLIFNELIRNYQDYLTEALVKEVDTMVVVDMMGYIDEHYKSVTLKEMAKVFNYNADYLGKQIKRLTGESLKSLVKKRKLKEAAKRLRNSEQSVLEIMDEVHYSNASYFYKQFKEEYGDTPDNYRKKQ